MRDMYIQVLFQIFLQGSKVKEYNAFLTGTDEHGQKIQKEAEKNKDPKIFCDEISETFRSLIKNEFNK